MLFFRRRVQCDRANVLIWCGSFWGRDHLTIGDAHAVQNLSERLAASGFEHCILSKSAWPFKSAPTVRDSRELRDDIDSLTLVCGPLAAHPALIRLMQKHPRARKLAVGVSVLDNHLDFARSFDAVLPRDGTAGAAFDMAPARFGENSDVPAPERGQPIALCFVGPQAEYGAGRKSIHRQAQDLLTRCVRGTGLPTKAISTVLSSRHRDERKILEDFRSVQLVATTRLHGSLYSLLTRRPVVALDQIPGGAKVSEVLARIGWPLVFRADEADEKRVAAALQTALSGELRDEVERARAELISLSQAALVAAANVVVTGTPGAGEEPGRGVRTKIAS